MYMYVCVGVSEGVFSHLCGSVYVCRRVLWTYVRRHMLLTCQHHHVRVCVRSETTYV